MTAWHVRDFEPYDLEAAVQLDTVSSATRQAPIFTLADVVGCLSEHPAVVAVADGQVIGTAIGGWTPTGPGSCGWHCHRPGGTGGWAANCWPRWSSGCWPAGCRG